MSGTDAAAFEHNGTLVSRQRFYEIACDPRRSVAVEACAGAGKTWMLVSRMLRALLEGCAPQDILAITFTKKAAGEMRERLQKWLIEFSTASDDQLAIELRARGLTSIDAPQHIAALRKLHSTLLHSGRPVQIRTFHSWFAALVRNAPLAVLHELGLPTTYELLEDDKKAVALVWRRFQGRVAQDPLARADYAEAVANYGRHNAHKALEAALAKRTEFLLADARGIVDASVRRLEDQFPEYSGQSEPVEYLFGKTATDVLQEAAKTLGKQSGKKCQTAASDLEQALTVRDADGVILALFTKLGEPRKLGDFDGAQRVTDAQELLRRYQAAQNQHQAWLHQQRMARLSRGLIDDYASLKRERGWVDMGDLESAALILMSDPVLSGWVQERLDTRVRHLLIDEFQDTNPLQWQALHAWLSGYTGAGTAPSVFIVGDPKQSIYRFRRAEPQVFIAAKEFVRNGLQGEVLSCDHTRRNAQAIIGLVNTVMGEAQAQGQFDGFRAHSTESELPGEVIKLARIAREPKAKVRAQATTELEDELTWRDSLSTPRFEEEASRKSIECRQAAQWILQALQSRRMPDGRALLPGDIMVLARKRERLALMQAELSTLHIAAQQPEKNDLAEMPEVQDLVALLDVLVSPRHDIALGRVLKSPLFGVSDDALVRLVRSQRALQAQAPEDQVVSWLETLQRGVDLTPALTEAGTMLLQWQDWVANLPPHDALSSIYQSGDVLARYAAACTREMRDGVLANLKALLHAALAVDGGRYTTAYSLVRALRAGGIKAPVRADSTAVGLLTVHGAKGLEAPVVVLLDTDGEAQKGESMGVLVEWPGQAEHPTRFVFLVSESRPSVCAVDALAAERLARSREELNGLYVALTRTQQMLVVSSMEPLSANPLSWWQRLQGHAQDVVPMPDAPLALLRTVQAADAGKNDLENFLLKELPARTLTGSPTPSSAVQSAVLVQESLESRIGQAMHRLLEWLPVLAGGYTKANAHAQFGLWPREQCTQAATEFILDATQVESAWRMALAIAQGQGAWCWDKAALQWHANEVPVNRGGRLLRIDRLVQDLDGQWWVLDYKSNAQPQLQPELCAQLTGYRATIQSAYPGKVVRCAFLTPQGALIEITNP